MASPNLLLLLPRGFSLRHWERVGLFDHSIGVYRALAETGWDVTIVSYGGADEAAYASRLPGMRIVFNSLGMSIAQYEGAMGRVHADALRRCHVIKSYQVDGAETALSVARVWKKPFVARCGYLLSDFALRGRAPEAELAGARRIESTIFQGADRAVVTTPWMQDYLANHYHVSAEKIRVIPNYVRTDRFHPDPDAAVPRRLVFVARLEPQKNPLALVEACAGLDVELVMIGTGSLGRAVADRAKEVGVRLQLLGVRSHDELPDLLRQGSLFVMPSSYEGHPKAVIEAMACGLPAVIGNVVGNNDLIEHGRTGWLCDVTVDAIRAAITSLLDNAPLRAQIGSSARRLVTEKFSFERVVALERAMLEELVAEGKPRLPSARRNVSEPAGESRFAESDAVVEWCLRHALRMERLGELERAALWAHVAAGTAAEYGHSYLCSAALESLLVRIGARVLPRESREQTAVAPPGRRWLHVFSETYAIGGHTALVRRWLRHNPFGERHGVALTVQAAADVAPELAAAVARTGGNVHSVAGAGSLIERASALRRLAIDEADVVVLHVHPWDVVPVIAFAGVDGPPVLLMNHADHAFWVGVAVADVVVDIRDSGRALSTSYRGARDSVVLPLPLEDRGPAPRTRSAAGQRLGDPTALERGLVLLTIGSPHKYRPAGKLDFAATIVRILEAVPDSVLVAVGPDPSDPAWRRLAARTPGRVVAVGPDADLAPWHAAADLYLEGFPIGSYTALLEVALAERAFVRKPLLAPTSALPVDRGALGAFDPPDDPDAYVAAAVALAADSDLRAARARTARNAVLAEHCGDGWTMRLDALQRAIPRQHSVGFGFSPPRMPEPMAAYWAGVLAKASGPRPLDYAVNQAQKNGLWPRFDVALLAAMRRRAE